MFPKVGDKVKITDELITYYRKKYIDRDVLQKRIDEIEGKTFEVKNIEVSYEGAEYKYIRLDNDRGVVIDKNGYCKDTTITAFIFINGNDDCLCPECGQIGEIDRMACICRNKNCARHIIWGI